MSILHAIETRADVETINRILTEVFELPSSCGACQNMKADPVRCGLSGRELNKEDVLISRPKHCPRWGE